MGYLVTVVGGGPTGLNCALKIKEHGFDVGVIEEHKKIGEPVNCSGLVSKSGLIESGYYDEDVIVNRISGAKIFAPNNDSIEVRRQETVAVVLDRARFDQSIEARAKAKGVEIKFGAKVRSIRGKNLFLEAGHGELIKSDIIVGADGVNSTVRQAAGIGLGRENFVHAIQRLAEGTFTPDMVEVHVGRFAPGYFAWVIPKSEKIAEIGLGATLGTNINSALEEFVAKRGEMVDWIGGPSSFLIPCGPPMKSVVKDNIMLVGDAGMHAKATTGGGIIIGLKASEICAQTIASHLIHKTPLENFDKSLEGINKELALHWKMRKYANSLSYEQMNGFFSKLKKAGIKEVLEEHGHMDYPSRFVGKIIANPRFWFLAPEFMKFQMT